MLILVLAILPNYDDMVSNCNLRILFLLLSCVGVKRLHVDQHEGKKTDLFLFRLKY